MTKTELISAVAQKAEISKKDAEKAVSEYQGRHSYLNAGRKLSRTGEKGRSRQHLVQGHEPRSIDERRGADGERRKGLSRQDSRGRSRQRDEL